MTSSKSPGQTDLNSEQPSTSKQSPKEDVSEAYWHQRIQALPVLQNRAQHVLKLVMKGINWEDKREYPESFAEFITEGYEPMRETPLVQKMQLFDCTSFGTVFN